MWCRRPWTRRGEPAVGAISRPLHIGSTPSWSLWAPTYFAHSSPAAESRPHPPLRCDTNVAVEGVVDVAVDIREVARRSGVSVATVSRALNARPGVSADTRARVTHVAREASATCPTCRHDRWSADGPTPSD